jgi:hypothetical protein
VAYFAPKYYFISFLLHLPQNSSTRLLSPPPPLFAIALGEPLARFDELDDVDPLLAEHDGEGDDGEDPGDGRVHFIRTAKHISIVSHDRTYASTPTYYVGRMETEVG